MFVKKTKHKSGRVYLSIAKNWREGGKTRSKTIRSLGYLDELEKLHDDPIAHFKAECEKENASAAQKNAAIEVKIHPAIKIDKHADNRKNIGCAIPLVYYNSLSIETTLRNHSRKRNFEYDINAIVRLLVTERMLFPGSKLSAFENKEHYFYRSDFSSHDMYRSLDFLGTETLRNSVVAAMNRQIEKMLTRDTTRVYYDVTNYYFETDTEDEMRVRYISKEHRKDPIVQMGLLQDVQGIPITYRLFPGNTPDCSTLLPVLKDIKDEFSLKRVIVVADKGLNCSDNIAANVAEGNGFVFSQSIRGTKSNQELKGWVLSDEGYEENADGSFKIKSRQDMKKITVESDEINKKTGKPVKKKVDVDVKVVAFWSSKYAERSRHLRADTIEKARELLEKPSAYERATHYGATKYLDNISFDKDSGEIRQADGKKICFNEERLAQDEACDGFYCIITSETDLSDEEIVDTYKGLWRIEEAFKVTKSIIESRPVFVWTPEHIQAHFLICYITLTLLRLIQLDIDYKHSAEAIVDEIKAMAGTHLQDNWWIFDHRTDLSDKLCDVAGLDLSRKYMQLSDIKQNFGKNKIPRMSPQKDVS